MGTSNRTTQIQTQTVLSGAAISGPVNYGGFAQGVLQTPATLSATTKIAFKASYDKGSNFSDLRNASNTLIELTVDLAAAHSYPLPSELAGADFFQIWTEASGSNVNQGADRVFSLSLKS